MRIEIRVTAESPIHLSSGQADVTVDTDVIHDAYGMPFFPGRRFKGLLYESAMEISEMGERSGIEVFSASSANKLFHHDSDEADVQLVISNLYLMKKNEYQATCEAWKKVQKKYAFLVQPQDVLNEYSTVRYQTKLKDGVAVKGSLHNMRVVDAGVSFQGIMELNGKDAEAYLPILAAAVKNLSVAGLKRNRGFGQIRCTMKVMDTNRTEREILEEVLRA